MQFETFAAFLDMGGHGQFVWLAYGITIVVLAGNWIWSGMKRSTILEAQKQLEEEQ